MKVGRVDTSGAEHPVLSDFIAALGRDLGRLPEFERGAVELLGEVGLFPSHHPDGLHVAELVRGSQYARQSVDALGETRVQRQLA